MITSIPLITISIAVMVITMRTICLA